MVCPVCQHEVPAGQACCGACGAPQPAEGAVRGALAIATVACLRLPGHRAVLERAPDLLPAAPGQDLLDVVVDVFLEGGGHRAEAEGDPPDEALVVFYEERPGHDAVEQSLHAAAKARALVRQLGTRAWQETGLPLELRVGLARGLVLFVETGGGEAAVEGALTAALARRIASAAGPDEILLDEATSRAVGRLVTLVQEPPLDRGAPPLQLPVWRLDVEALPESAASRQLLSDRFSRNLVGRDRELHHARTVFEEAVELGSMRRLLVMGPMGCGRTRFVRELVDRLRGSYSDLRVAEASLPTEEEAQEPFVLLSRLAASILHHDPSARSREETRRVEALLDDLAEGEPLLAEPFVRSRLLLLAGLAPPAELEAGDPEHAGEAAHAAVAALLRGSAARGPVVVLIDDLADATRPQLRTLARLGVATRDCPLLAVFNAPADIARRPGWAVMHGHDHVLELAPLPPDAGRVLIDQILGRRDALPRDVADRILEHARGLPLFLEEALSSLADVGLLVEEPSTGAWRLHGDGLPSGFPDSLPALLAARLDQMPTREADVLRRAAVAGSRFWRGLIEDLGEPQAPLHLRRLEQRGLVVRSFDDPIEGQAAYRFAHRATREVLRRDLPDETARGLHLQVARWLAVHAGERFHAWLAAIAWHFAEGRDPVRAVSYHLQAGRWARSLGDLEQALDQFERARRLAPDRNTAMEASLEVAEGHLAAGRHQEALEALREVLGWAEERRDLRAVLRCLVLRARGANAMDDRRAVEEAVARGLPLARSLGDVEAEASLELARARAAHAHGREEEALAAASEARRLAGEIDDALGTARAEVQRARALLHRGQLAAAAEAFADVADRARRLQHQLLHARARQGLAWVALVRGDDDRARALLSEAEPVVERLGMGRLSVRLLAARTLLALGEGEHAEAANHAAAALERAELLENRLLCALGHALVGHVYGTVETGRHRLKARDLSEAAIRYAKVDRADHLREGVAEMARWEGAPRLYHALAALFAAEYLLATAPDDDFGREAAGTALRLLADFEPCPLRERAYALAELGSATLTGS